MARPAKKQQPQKFEEPDEAEGWEDAVVETDDKDGEQNLRLRDWRDVERFREMKELRRLVDDDYGLEEIFHIPVKPRTDLGIPAPHTPPGKPVKGAPPAKPAPSNAKARSEGNTPSVKGALPAKNAQPVKGAAPAKNAPATKTAPAAKAAAPVRESAPAKHAKPAAKPAARHVKAKAKRK